MDLGGALDLGANVMTFGAYGAAKNALGGFNLGNALGVQNNYQANLDPTVLAQQQEFVKALQDQSRGVGPSLASAQFNQASNQNLAGAMGIAAAQRGVNPALAARQAQQAFSQGQAQATGQAATTAAQQQLATQQALGNQLNSMQGQYLQNHGINAGVAAGNAQNNAQMWGGLMGAAGSALTGTPMFGGGSASNSSLGHANNGGYYAVDSYANGGMAESSLANYFMNPMTAAHGNTVPGTPMVKGDNPVNDTVPAMLSPGEIVIPNSILQGKNPGEEAKKFVEQEIAKHGKKKDNVGYAEGGEVDFVGPDILGQTKEKLAADIPNAEPSYQAYYDILAKDPVAAEMAVKAGTVQAPPSLGSKITGAIGDIRESNLARQMETAGIPQNQEIATPQPAVATPDLMQHVQAQPEVKAPMPNVSGGYDKMISGLNQEAAAAGQLGQQQAKILENQNAQLNAIKADFEQKRQTYDNEIASYQAEIQEGKIDPNRYMSNLSTGGKIATMVGLILGGIGGGLQGRGGNVALDTLNNIINRDIEAQKMDMDKKKTLLGFSMQKMGNLRDAEAYSRAILIAQTSNELQAAAAKSQDPIAKARAMQAIGQLEQQKNQTLSQLAARQAIASGQKVDKEVLSEDQRQRYVDAEGFRGLANTKEEGVKFRESIPAYKDTISSLDRLIQLSKEGNKAVSREKIAEAQQLKYLLGGTMREDVLGPGTVSPEERRIMLEEVLADPSTIFSLDNVTRTKLINLKNKITTKKANQAKSMGLSASTTSESPLDSKMSPADKRIYEVASKNPKNPNAQKALAILKDKYGI